MDLHKDEVLVKEFHHDVICFIERSVKVVIASLPILYMMSIFAGFFSTEVVISAYLVVAAIFSMLIANDVFLFYMDRLIITNKRIIHVDWKSLFSKTESEAELSDIQDIKTTSGGILTLLPFFNFGTFSAETASTKTSIRFENAPAPDEIKDLIYHLTIKPCKIEAAGNLNTINDPARERSKQEVA